MKRLLPLVSLAALLAAPAFAQITAAPPLMNFQGRLAKPDGTPLPDGFYVVTFSLWNVANGGSIMTNQVWSETSAVTLRNGTFAVVLGKSAPLADSLFAGNLYLQIQVGNDAALTPRQQLISVGYAFRANIANTVPDGSITAAKLSASLTFPPTGTAGGNLTGTYPNPFLSNNTVNANRLASDASSLSKVSGGVMFSSGGNIGIGITSPQERLHINGDVLFENQNVLRARNASGVSDGFLWPRWSDNVTYLNYGVGGFNIRNNASNSMLFVQDNGNVGIGTTGPQSRLDVNGTITASAVQVTGADVAEPYTIAAAKDVQPAPGIVVVIQPHTPGHLQVSQSAYDRKVAGIISGANGVRPGLVLRQPGTLADGNLPVASSGRVYCWCDADANGPIEEGDQLTTSNTPGHAMRVSDYDKARGSILGKAMSSLKSGKGMVLVLVTLQ